MKLIIKEANEQDLAGILELYGQPDMDNGSVINLEEARRIFFEMAAYPNYRLFVAKADEETVGTFALLIMDNLAHMGAKSGVIEDVVVKTAWQHKGIGKQMMQFAAERCEEAHCYKMALSSNSKREAAHRFYESLGFQRHGISFSMTSDSSTVK